MREAERKKLIGSAQITRFLLEEALSNYHLSLSVSISMSMLQPLPVTSHEFPFSNRSPREEERGTTLFGFLHFLSLCFISNHKSSSSRFAASAFEKNVICKFVNENETESHKLRPNEF